MKIMCFAALFGVIGCSHHTTLLPVSSVAFSADGKYLAAGGGQWLPANPPWSRDRGDRGGDGEVTMWDVDTRSQIFHDRSPFTSIVEKVMFSENDLVAFSRAVRRHTRGNPYLGYQFSAIAWKEEAKWRTFIHDWHQIKAKGVLVTGEKLRCIYVCEGQTIALNGSLPVIGRARLFWSQFGVGAQSMPFDSVTNIEHGIGDVILYGKRLEAGYGVQCLNLAKREEETRVNLAYPPRSIKFLREGKHIAICGDAGLLEIFESANGKRLVTINLNIGSSGKVLDVSPDGKLVAVKTEPSAFRIVNVGDRKIVVEQKRGAKQVECGVFSPDSALFAVAFRGADGAGAVSVYSARKIGVSFPLSLAQEVR